MKWGYAAVQRGRGRSFNLIVQRSQKGVPFVPGLGLIAIGLVVLIAPKLIFYALGMLLLLVGCVVSVVAWKVLQFRKRFLEMQANLGGRVEVHQIRPRQTSGQFDDDPDNTIIIH